MKVIGGKYKGRNIYSLEGNDVRPTLSRVKEAMFNIIQYDLKDKIVLDLFSGSGALGIEAFSRGAKKVIFVEAFRAGIELLANNLRFVTEEKEILCCDAVRGIERVRGQKFDFVFMDPPYDYDTTELFKAIFKKDILTDDATIVYEHAKSKGYVLPEGLIEKDVRHYGIVALSFIGRKDG